MADNIARTDEVGGLPVRTDEVGGAHYQVIKLALGADGSATMVELGAQLSAASVPVVLASDQAAIDVGDISGTISLPAGASTAANQVTGNASLSSIETDVGTLAGAVSGTEFQVDVVSSALPTGAATSSLQTTGNSSLATIATNTGTLAGAVSGSEMQVDVVAPLPAGSNTIGVVHANLQDGAGTDLTSTLVGSDQALDVNVVQTAGGSGLATEATLASILTDTNTLAGAVSGTEFQVDVLTSALPTGAATSANQLPDGHNVTVDNASVTVDNSVLSVVGGGTEATAQRVTIANDSTGVLTVDGTVTANIGTIAGIATETTLASILSGQLADGHNVTVDNASIAVTGTVTANLGTIADVATETTLSAIDTDTSTIAGAVSGSEMQVDIVSDGAGLALAANQLADGHNVTVDNASIAVTGTVSVTHPAIGGGTEATAQRVTIANDSTGVVTVDGTVTANLGTIGGVATEATLATIDTDTGNIATSTATIAGAVSGTEMQVDIVAALPAGTNNIGDVDVLTLPDVTQSTHDNLNANANIQVANADVSPSNPVAVQGRAADGAAVQDNPVLVAFQDASGNVAVPTGFSAAGFNVLGAAIVDTSAHLWDIESTGEGNVAAVGKTAHDAADAGDNPVKIGGVAEDYDTVPSGADPGATEVADSDVVQLSLDQAGRIVERPISRYVVLTAINTDYDTTNEVNVSAAIDCEKYRTCTLAYSITETGTATDIRFEVEVSLDGTNYFLLTNDALGSLLYDDATISSLGTLSEAYTFDVCYQSIRVRVTTQGTNNSGNEFTVSNAALYLRN